MRRVRLTEGQLHRIIRHAVNEAVESNEESYMLKGISISLLSSDEDGNWDEETESNWNDSLMAESLEGLIKKLSDTYGVDFDMNALSYGDGYFQYTIATDETNASQFTFKVFKTAPISDEEIRNSGVNM